MSQDALDFARTGPGTLAGRYLRRFWQPVSRVQDLEPGQARPVQIMSEKYTLYRGDDGTPHLLGSRCAHRGTQLSTGWVEGDCLRCLYHGWKYDASGQCVEQPGEDESFASKIRIPSYPVREYLGLIFAYLGEGEPAEFRRFPDFERPFYFEAGPPEIWPCSYFNRLENDPAHVPWVHRESLTRAGRHERLVVRSIEAEETEYGVRAASSVPDRPIEYVHYYMPNITQTRSRARVEGAPADAVNLWADRLFFHVPIDDEHYVTFVLDLIHLTGAGVDAYAARRRSAQEADPATLNPIAEQVINGTLRLGDVDRDLTTYKLFWIEDYCSMVGQGAIPDRDGDHLGRNDGHVILLRKIWRRELAALRDGLPLKEWLAPARLADMSLVAI